MSRRIGRRRVAYVSQTSVANSCAVSVHGAVGPQSDIDLLVDMDHGRSLLDLAALHLELEDLLEFPAELGTDVKPRLRERVHAEAIAL